MNWTVYEGNSKTVLKSKIERDVWGFEWDDWLERLLLSLPGATAVPATEWVSNGTLASISGNTRLFKMISLTVDDENGWLEVIQLLRDWKSKGCREARIDLKLKVQKRVMVVGVENPPHTTPHIMSDDDTDYISSRRRAKIAKLQEEERDDKKRRNKKSATEKALDDEQGHRDADAAAEHYTTNIIEQNRCKTKACSVDAIPCRIIRGQHVRCTVAEISAGSIGIEDSPMLAS
jgi:hypothetical protein